MASDAAAPATAVAPDAVVLTIGDQKMTRAQYEQFVAALPDQLRPNATGPNKRKFAEQVAEMKSYAAEARRRNLDQTQSFKLRLALDVDNLLANELLRLLNADVKVDPGAAKAYYDQHPSEFEEAKAAHILIRFQGSQVPLKTGEKDLTEAEALEKAKALREKIVKGADFAALAKAESDDTGSGANGGSLGTFGHGRMIQVFDNAAFSLPLGVISEPVKSPFGYHLIRVDERTTKKFEEVQSQIETKVKQEAGRKAVEEFRKTVPVKVDDSYFGK